MNPEELAQRHRWNQSSAEIYDGWRQRKVAHFIDERYTSMLATLAQPGLRVLEIGCGAGHLLEKLKVIRPAAKFAGIDISETMVERARARGFDDVSVGSGNALTFPDAAFDVVLSGAWVFRYLDRQTALNEAFRVLKPGGILAFDIPFSPPHFLVKMSRILRQNPRLWWGEITDSHFNLDGISVTSWRKSIAKSGFRMLDTVGGIDVPWQSDLYSFRQPHRTWLGLKLSSVIWFQAEKPANP